MTRLSLIPALFLTACGACPTLTQQQIEEFLKLPAAEQRDCLCERPSDTPIDRGHEARTPTADQPDPQTPDDPDDLDQGKEPDRKTDPDGWGHWREEMDRHQEKNGE